MNQQRPIDRFVHRTSNVLQTEYVVIGKQRVSSLFAWSLITFFVGVTVTSAFLASRSGAFEGTYAATTQVFQASTDFTTYAGRQSAIVDSDPNRWLYLDGHGDKLVDYSTTNPNCGAPCWAQSRSGAGQYLLIKAGIQHPGNGSELTSTGESIRAWVVPGDGTARITATVKDAGGSCGGDGVRVKIKQGDGNIIWQEDIPDNNVGFPSGKSVDRTITVTAAQFIYFIVNKLSVNNWCDTTQFDPKIEFTPSGGTPPSSNLADLVITDIRTTPTVLSIGTAVTFSATIRNQGGAGVPAGIWIGVPFYIDGVYTGIWTGTSGGIAPGQSVDIGPSSGSWIATTGSHTIGTLVDDQQKVTESVEINNDDYTEQITVGAPTSPSESVTIKKTFLGISAFTPTIKLDDRNPDSQTGNALTWNNVTAGNHSIASSLPSGVKAYKAFCRGDSSCTGPFDQGTLGPTTLTLSFIHSSGQTDGGRIIYANAASYRSTSHARLDLGACKVSDGWADPTISATRPMQVPISEMWAGEEGSEQQCEEWVYIADTKGENGSIDGPGDLYSEVEKVAQQWDEATNIALTMGLNGYPLYSATYYPPTSGTTLVNGIKSYDAIQKEDGRNLIGYSVDPRTGVDDICHLPDGSIDRSVGQTHKEILVTSQGNYILEFDLELNPAITIPLDELRELLLHEIGHGIGLMHNSLGPSRGEGSIMSYENEGGYITGFDVAAVNGKYKNCKNSLPKKGAISLEVTNQPAPLFYGTCKNSSRSPYWQLSTVIKETSGIHSVTLKNYMIEYWGQNNVKLHTTPSLPFYDFTIVGSGGSSKAFFDLVVNPGETMNAGLCQVPWDPEEISWLRLHILGVDDQGNSVEASERVYPYKY